MMFDMEIAPPVAAIDDDDSVFEAEKSRYASLLFAELSKFQKVGVLCDVQIGRRHPRHDDDGAAANNAHKVVLMSLTTSPSASDDDDDRVTTPADVDARDHFRFDDIEDAYAPKRDDDDDDDVAHRLHLLNHLRLTQRCCDVTLTCDDGAVCQAHRVVLAACSDYFRAMFTLRMREQEQARVALRSVSGCCLRRLLHFMYTGEAALESCHAASHLLDAAVYYQMPALVARCCRYLGARVDDSNCCRLTWLARELSLPELADRCLRVAADRFARLDAADSDVELLAADDLIACVRRGAAPEAVAFSVALRWLAANDGGRAAEVLAAVRYALIPSADLLAAVARIFPAIGNRDRDDDVESAICDFVSAARGYHDDVHAQPLAQCADTQLREVEARWVCVDGVVAARRVRLPLSSPRVTVVNRPATATAHDDRLPIRDPFHAVVEFNGFVFAIGGTRQGKAGFSRNVARYDPRLDTWTSVAAMNEERGDFVAERVGDVIVVAGGRNRRGYLSTCEMYDPRTNRWSYIASLPQATYMAAGVACGDSLYLSGGFDEHEALNTTLRYDLAADRWTTLPARMLTFRGYHVMVLAPDGRLWAVGGIDHPFAGRNVWEVEAFDVATQRWQFVGQVLPTKPFLSTMRLNATVNSRGRVCVFPVTGARRLPTIEFDADRRMWFEQSDPTPVHQIDQPDADV